jgi:lipopolysaccharide/colanic/teichoic acid biosynthesis glycosyltransferase
MVHSSMTVLADKDRLLVDVQPEQRRKVQTERNKRLERELRRIRFHSSKLHARAQELTFRASKRSLDIVVSALMLAGLLPLFLLLAAAIKVHDRGPVLFWQNRVGRWGRVFRFPKFRSMVVDAEKVRNELISQNQHGDGVTFKMKRDPRITPIGRLIRKFSLDELPQLWCVLKGEMTLVGPRPPLPKEVARYSLADRRRLEVTPGLTCFWQVQGRADIPFEQQVKLDVEYIEQRSLTLDFRLLFATVPAVLTGRGAY